MINNILPLTGAEQQSMGAGGWISMILVYGVFIVVLWLIFFRPQSKKRKKEEAMRKSCLLYTSRAKKFLLCFKVRR